MFFREALSFIEDNRDRPFFCYISTNAPHGPFNVEARYRDLYKDHTKNEYYARFLGMITNIDDNFGLLRRKLKELELEDNTVLVFMSDNGQTGVGERDAETFNAGMRGIKGSPYDGGHRVPFFIRWLAGKVRTGLDINELTSYVDFMPTVLDLCKVDVPAGHAFHGESLVPLLQGETDEHWAGRTITTDTQRVAYPLKWRNSCVMKDRWRLVNRTELYDLKEDPGQEKDVAAHHPGIVADLQEEYEKWWDICAEQMDSETPISLGGEQEIAVLRTMDQRNELDLGVVWNQAQVRRGDVCHGWWKAMVEREGLYEFDMRCWPVEVGHRIRGGIEGEDVEYRKDDIEPGAAGYYSGGKVLNYDTATLSVSGLPGQCATVSPDDRGAVIRLRLPVGLRQVRAQFSSTGWEYCSAYCVYVRRVE